MIKMNFYMVATIVATVLQIGICVGLTPVWGLYVVPVSSTFFYGSVVIVTLAHIRHELGSIGMRSIVRTTARALVLGGLGALVGAAILAVLAYAMGPCQGIAAARYTACLAASLPCSSRLASPMRGASPRPRSSTPCSRASPAAPGSTSPGPVRGRGRHNT